MKFIPTMNFNGQCREAMEMYRKTFGGMATALLTYGEVNDPAYLLSEEQKNWIYHGELTFGDQRIIAEVKSLLPVPKADGRNWT